MLDILATQQTLTISELEKIHRAKTGDLISAAVRCGALCSEQIDNEILNKLDIYSRNIGLAFQISDDVLDYTAESNEQIGKNIGDDLSGGKITLPFIYAFQYCTETQREILKDIIQNRKVEDFIILRDIIIETNSIKFTQEKAKEFVSAAKENLKVVEKQTTAKG